MEAADLYEAFNMILTVFKLLAGIFAHFSAMVSDAVHSASDVFSTVVVMVTAAILSIVVKETMYWYTRYAAYDIFKDAVNKVVDHSCDEETEKQLYDCIAMDSQAESIDLFQTRMFDNKIYVDIEIGLNGQYTLQKAHAIAKGQPVYWLSFSSILLSTSISLNLMALGPRNSPLFHKGLKVSTFSISDGSGADRCSSEFFMLLTSQDSMGKI